jgi:hypothetical protein
MMRLTDDQLFAYLDGGEDDPLVAEMLKLDADARTRLALIRRIRAQLASVTQSPSRSVQSIAHQRAPVIGIRGMNLEIPMRLRGLAKSWDRVQEGADPLVAFLQGKAERRDLGEVRIPAPSDAGPGPRVLAELRAEQCGVEVGLSGAGESQMLWVRIRGLDARPIVGVPANLLVPGVPVQRFTTDAEGLFELPVPEGAALLRIELEPTCEIRLVPSTDL